MKQQIIFILLLSATAINTSNAQNGHSEENHSGHQHNGHHSAIIQNVNTITSNFRVYGNCSMCEKTIESAVNKLKGVSAADWDKETDNMMVRYDPKLISLETIKQKIAKAGYDSDTHRAKDKDYFLLPDCCQYERPE